MARSDYIIETLKTVGEYLVPFSSPQQGLSERESLAEMARQEDLVVALKKQELDADGYSVVIHYNKADFKKYYLETVQIFGKYVPFLPFHLVVKVARKVLGGAHLAFVEFYQDNRKIYCWSVCLDREGRPIPYPLEKKSKTCEFEGFAYKYVHPSQLNFY